MPEIKLQTHSSYLKQVVNAFEGELGLPISSGPDTAWLKTLVAEYNKANETDIEYSHEDYGYWFSYTTPAEAKLLAALREEYKLGGA